MALAYKDKGGDDLPVKYTRLIQTPLHCQHQSAPERKTKEDKFGPLMMISLWSLPKEDGYFFSKVFPKISSTHRISSLNYLDPGSLTCFLQLLQWIQWSWVYTVASRASSLSSWEIKGWASPRLFTNLSTWLIRVRLLDNHMHFSF